MWVLLFGAIALGGLIVMISYAGVAVAQGVRPVQRLEMLATRMEELADLLGQIQPVLRAIHRARVGPLLRRTKEGECRTAGSGRSWW